jgi:hypothetical protein
MTSSCARAIGVRAAATADARISIAERSILGAVLVGEASLGSIVRKRAAVSAAFLLDVERPLLRAACPGPEREREGERGSPQGVSATMASASARAKPPT